MVVSDVATSGNTIARPAACLRELGAVVPAAFVLLDRCQGAEENLAKQNIELVGYLKLNKRDQVLNERISDPQLL